jgi:hypothetical protein
MKKAPKSNRHLSEHISLALNKTRKPSIAGEITELLNRDLEQGERPFEEKRHRAVVARQRRHNVNIVLVKGSSPKIRTIRLRLFDAKIL